MKCTKEEQIGHFIFASREIFFPSHKVTSYSHKLKTKRFKRWPWESFIVVILLVYLDHVDTSLGWGDPLNI